MAMRIKHFSNVFGPGTYVVLKDIEGLLGEPDVALVAEFDNRKEAQAYINTHTGNFADACGLCGGSYCSCGE